MPRSSLSTATSLLKRKLGSALVFTDPDTCYAASFDSGRMSFLPHAVIKPRQREDVGVVLALANRYGVPVTPRGRGTTLMGSATPREGGWVLDLLKLNRIRIDAEAGFAHVQAGAVIAKIQDAAAARGWFYPPDPSSKAYCTIGGNVACNSGGMHGGKYGVTRDFIIALKGFLPTGEYVEWGTATRKFAAGFNLRDLWIGGEGMLGVVTDAVLRLIPQPAARWTLLTSFPDEVSAFRAARALFKARVQPAICEFLDRHSVQCAESAMGTTIFPGQPGRPVVLLELAGSAAEVKETKKTVLAWAKVHALGHRTARTRDEAESLWAVRRKCSGAMFQMGDGKLNEDVTVPLATYEKFARFLDRLRKSSGLAIPTFGHLGDGNLHVNIMYHKADPDACRRAETAVKQLMEKVVELGGAISGEHGIGLAKTPFLRLQHSAAEIGAMQAIKRALDPQGILNPGKMFEVFETWKCPKVDAAFPWDHK
ncbi:FAD-binding oxidoreductase [Synoicihabitans lomoniglobus]|uniref:FAD-linked oxidase C-terminal domain-containing protein n=1 Tax=Synoicihabitans lomoniglobus TaxID=2909285 RepID=A0AAF0CRF5_9BACT|nr:FAD-binding protein [Opitutaceae bacterium LMO-M01]WED66685.1 FAD-linked oxidase C-terminal domain-containing protein [Opitutaceae bacterium LMO-M01]